MQTKSSFSFSQRFKSAQGYSLVNVLIGLAIASLIGIGAMSLMQETFQWNSNANIQAEMDRSHYLTIQESKNITYLSSLLALDPTRLTCLTRQATTETGAGTSCANQFASGWANIPTATKTVNAGTNLQIQTTYDYMATCTYTACSQVSFRVRSKALRNGVAMATMKTADAATAQTRESIFTIPSYMFSNIAQFRFDCAQLAGAKQIITGVTADKQEARCDPLQGVGICQPPLAEKSYAPMRGLEPSLACFTLSPKITCANGVDAAGMKLNDSTCIQNPIQVRAAPLGTAPCPRGDRKTACGCTSAEIETQLAPYYSTGYIDSTNQLGMTLPTCTYSKGICRAVECGLPSTTGTTTTTVAPTCVVGSLVSAMVTPASSPYSWSPDSVGTARDYIRQLRLASQTLSFPNASNVDSLESALNAFITSRLSPASAALAGTTSGGNGEIQWKFTLATATVGGSPGVSGYAVAIFIQLQSNAAICP